MCEAICIGIIVIIVVYIIIMIGLSISAANDRKKAEAERKREEERRAQEAERFRINSLKDRYNSACSSFYSALDDYFNGTSVSYQNLYTRLLGYVEDMKKANSEIPEDEQFEQNGTEPLVALADEFDRFCMSFDKDMKLFMLDANEYGNINKKHYDRIISLDKKLIDAKLTAYETDIRKRKYEKIWEIRLASIMDIVWFYALYKPYSASDFERAKALFHVFVRERNIEVFIAEIYAIKQIGGTNVIKNKIRDMLNAGHKDSYKEYKSSSDADILSILASGLMWVQAYSEESTVLQYMLENKIQMSAKLQERLHALSNGGGDAPENYDVESGHTEFYLDVSALTWQDKDYNAFFENMSFQEKVLLYSLAIRDEDKDLFINQNTNFPKNDYICEKINSVFAEEYGEGVRAENVDCTALSGNGSESINGILARTVECSQLGLFVHIARIGKKLNIKFYTTFVPNGESIEEQKQKAVSICKKLSPTVTMWENGLKDTILLAIQQILNSGDVTTAETIVSTKDEPIVF